MKMNMAMLGFYRGENRAGPCACEEGPPYRIIAGSVFVYQGPNPDALLETEALFGEGVSILEDLGEWIKIRLSTDGCEGYVPRGAVGPQTGPVTHYIAALRSYIYCAPNIKSPDAFVVSFNSHLSVVDFDGEFARLAGEDGYVYARHLRPVGYDEIDFVSVAMRFLHTAYRWAGRSSIGLDCSGLVQTALFAVGHRVPRNSGDQEKAIGVEVDWKWSGLRRGDLVFWKGHVGIMQDTETILHSNGHSMSVVAESLYGARERIKCDVGEDITSVRRIPDSPG